MSDLNKEVVDLVWGRQTSTSMTDALFRRWTQGFVFSETERTALEQFEGGPCAVIAPVQAFLMKNVLFNSERSNWRDISDEEQKAALCCTLTEILEMACLNKSQSYCLVTWAKGKISDQNSDIPDSHPEPSQSREDHQPSALAAEEVGFERFHTVLHKRTLKTSEELKDTVLALYDTWRNQFGVLLFLYSVILTKGIENIKNEIEDTAEPLIDPVYGHGSQSLINLLMTGHAVSNVWDGDRECSGMNTAARMQQMKPPPWSPKLTFRCNPALAKERKVRKIRTATTHPLHCSPSLGKGSLACYVTGGFTQSKEEVQGAFYFGLESPNPAIGRHLYYCLGISRHWNFSHGMFSLIYTISTSELASTISVKRTC